MQLARCVEKGVKIFWRAQDFNRTEDNKGTLKLLAQHYFAHKKYITILTSAENETLMGEQSGVGCMACFFWKGKKFRNMSRASCQIGRTSPNNLREALGRTPMRY